MDFKKLSLLTLIFLWGFKSVYAQEEQNCNQAQLYVQQFQYSKAIASFEHCLNENSDIHLWSLLADCYHKNGQLADAVKTYKKILDITPNQVGAMNQLANIYQKQSHYKKAALLYQQLSVLDTANAYYPYQLGYLTEKMNDYIQALSFYELSYQLNDKNVMLRIRLAKLYMKLKQYDQALILIEGGVALDKENITLYELKTEVLYQLHEYKGVIEAANIAIELHQDTSAYILQKMSYAYYMMHEYQTALPLFESMEQRKIQSELNYYYHGKVLRALGQYADSRLYFEKAIKKGISSNTAVYYASIGIAHEKEGKYRAAIDAYEKAYEYSEDPLLLYHIARNYDLCFKDKKPAVRYYEKYLASQDTVNKEHLEYSRYRISEIKIDEHIRR